MLRLSKQADYGLVLLSHFAQRESGAILSARDLALETGLPAPMVSKILKALARAGILGSHRGVRGGYSLAHDPESISVARIVQAFDGPIGVTDCSPHVTRTCDHEPRCPVRAPLQRLNAVVRSTLEQVSLRELVTPDLVSLELPGGAHATTFHPLRP
jgi:FeS assembly SUF system regulator